MSSLVAGLVWERARPREDDLLVLLAIADSVNDEGFGRAERSVLARKCRITVERLDEIIRTLGTQQYLETEDNKYVVNVELLSSLEARYK